MGAHLSEPHLIITTRKVTVLMYVCICVVIIIQVFITHVQALQYY